jgi:phosphoribosylaminoimidazolecarboxamide formyltransferase / IMP cyclohydrolase
MINRVAAINDLVRVKNVIISVADKNKLDFFVNELAEINPDCAIYSTGGTHRKIADILGDKGNKNLVKISDYTGNREMQGGLVKTLDYKLYLGLLSEPGNAAHEQDLKSTASVSFDMVVVNLYPFSRKITEKETKLEDARAFIDIGGPCLLRAAAKNFLRVASLCDPEDYEDVIQEMRENSGALGFNRRLRLAAKAFAHTNEYDGEITSYLSERLREDVHTEYSFTDR